MHHNDTYSRRHFTRVPHSTPVHSSQIIKNIFHNKKKEENPQQKEIIVSFHITIFHRQFFPFNLTWLFNEICWSTFAFVDTAAGGGGVAIDVTATVSIGVVILVVCCFCCCDWCPCGCINLFLSRKCCWWCNGWPVAVVAARAATAAVTIICYLCGRHDLELLLYWQHSTFLNACRNTLLNIV